MPTIENLLPQMQQKSTTDLIEILSSPHDWSEEALEAARISLKERTDVDESLDRSTPTIDQINKSFAGDARTDSKIRGWLLLYVIRTTILGPLTIFGNISNWLNSDYSKTGPITIAFITFVSIASLILAVLSIIVGSRVWLIIKNSILFAKIMEILWIALSSTFAILAVLLFGSNGISFVVESCLVSAIGSTIWLLYLIFSKRVKATFSELSRSA